MPKYLISVILLITMLCSCQGGSSSTKSLADCIDSMRKEQEMIDLFFTQFQEENDGWTKSIEGHEKLKKAFEDKMTSDIVFAKAIASYGTNSEYRNRIRKHESITSYNKDNGEEGEIKAFEFVIPVELTKPLYNGQKEIEVSYEIISTIPSTIEEHWRPYVDNANYCSTFDSYFNSSRSGVLNLGSFVITRKD